MSKRVWVLIAVTLLLALPLQGQAQYKQQKIRFSSLLNGAAKARGLVGLLGIDPSRFHMSQSYSLALMSIGGRSYSQGVYLNSMQYQFSAPLTVNLEWGIMNSPLATMGVQSPFKNGFFLSGASLEYKPSSNFHIGVQYSTYPGYAYPRRFPGQVGWQPQPEK